MKATGMKKLGIIAALAFAFALCFALVGCGGSGSSDEGAKNIKGDYKLVGMEEAGITYSESDLASLEELGLTCTLALADGEKATLTLFGESMDGTWKATSEKECEITIDSDKIKGTLDGDKLTLSDSDASLVFKKM